MGGQSKKLISFKSHQRKVVPTSATKHWAPTSVPAQHARWWAHGVNDIHPSIRSSVHPWKLSKTQKEKQKLKVEKTEMTPQWWEKVSTLRPKGETVGNHIRREWKRKSWNLNCVLWALCCAVTLSLSLSLSLSLCVALHTFLSLLLHAKTSSCHTLAIMQSPIYPPTFIKIKSKGNFRIPRNISQSLSLSLSLSLSVFFLCFLFCFLPLTECFFGNHLMWSSFLS